MIHPSTIKTLIATLLCWSVATTIEAQGVKAGIDAYGFFDNSEGDDTYRTALTHSGIRLTPRLEVSSNNDEHHLVGGYAFYQEFGEGKMGKGHPEMYYKYNGKKLRVLFGCFPRTLMHDQLTDYLVCDSIRYYRPEMSGFDFLYTTEKGHLEVFCDWTQLRSETEREQFMAGLTTRFRLGRHFQLGIEGYLYHYALKWNNDDHSIHEVITGHPFVGWLSDDVAKGLQLDFRAGMLIQADRDRAEGEGTWHCPLGFVGDLGADWKRFSLHETFYAGKRQQYFGNDGFGKYYWGDTFLQSPWYSRTDLAYRIAQHKNAQLEARCVFNVTDKGLQWHQMLTLRCGFDFDIKKKK